MLDHDTVVALFHCAVGENSVLKRSAENFSTASPNGDER